MEKRKENLRNKRVCRFCLKDDEPLTSIFDRSIRAKNSVPLALQIMACVAIEVFPSDGMPSTICQVCRYFMDQSYRFKQICRQGDEALRHFIAHGDLRPPIPWPQDMIMNVPQEVLATTSVQIASAEPGSEEELEEEVDLPFDEEVIEKITHGNQKGRDKRSVSKSKKKPKEKSNSPSIVVQSFDTNDDSEITVDVKLSDSKDNIVIENVPAVKESFPCSECHQTFPLKQLLDLHMDSHNKKRTHKCPLCTKAFFNKYDLQTHLMLHSGVKPFECVVCQRKFGRISFLRRHEKIHRSVTKYSCSECKDVFLSLNSLEEHVLKKHSSNRPFKCNLCDKSFTFKQGLERHLTVHNNQAFKCDYCPEAFSAPNYLHRHISQKHAGTRPYLCKYCPKSFILPHHYTRHLKTKHTNVSVDNSMKQRIVVDYEDGATIQPKKRELFKCVQCDETFNKQDDLIFHSAVHATQDLTCPLCKETFEDVEDVVVHIKSHIEGAQYVCEYCDLVFTTEEKLEDHIDNEHKDQIDFAEVSYYEGEDVKYKGQEDGNETLDETAADEEECEEEQELYTDEEAASQQETDAEVTVEAELCQNVKPEDGSVVVEWKSITESQQNELQQLMVVGGGETIVYHLADNQQETKSGIHELPISSVNIEAPCSTDLEQTITSVTEETTPASSQSPLPVYAELKTVDVPKLIQENEQSHSQQQEPQVLSAPAKLSDTAEIIPPKPALGKASILQKAEEVKLQKIKIEEMKQKAKEMKVQQGNNSGESPKQNLLKREREQSAEFLPQPKKQAPERNEESNHTAKTVEAGSGDKLSSKKYVQKVLSFSKKSADEDKPSKAIGSSSPVKASSDWCPKKSSLDVIKESPKIETPPRNREKSLMMLERDIMELKKNAGLTSNSQSSTSSKYVGTKLSRTSIITSTSRKLSPQKEIERSKLMSPIKIKPLQESPTRETETLVLTDLTELIKRQVEPQPIPESTKVSGGGDSSPRRSRRASKIKDYAAMIRENTKVDSDEDEYDDIDNTSGFDDTAQTAGSIEEDSDDDIDINDEVLIHRSTPYKPKVPGRKRGRPRKTPLPADSTPKPSPSIRQNQVKKVSAPDLKRNKLEELVKATSEGIPIKRKRGRPSKKELEERAAQETSQNKPPEIQPPAIPSNNVQEEAPPVEQNLTQKKESIVPIVKQEGGSVIMSPGGTQLKKVPAQLIKSLPPGVKPLPLPSSISTMSGPVGQISEMKIGPKTVRVQKILMTKSQLQAMTEKGLVHIKDGAMVLKPGVKLPTPEAMKESTTKLDVETSVEDITKTLQSINESEMIDTTESESSQQSQ